MKTILVPYDFSKCSINALDFAVNFAKKSILVEIRLLYVIDFPEDSGVNITGNVTNINSLDINDVFVFKLVEAKKKELKNISESYKNQTDIKINYELRIGNPKLEIPKIINNEKISIVIMGTTGTTGLEEMMIGSVAERVVRTSKVPVITIRNKVDFDKIKDIVFASNFEDLSINLVNALKDLQSTLDATIRFVKINTPSSFNTNRNNTAIIKNFVEKNNFKNYTIKIYSHLNEEDGIISYVEDIDANMIALGTHQFTGFHHLLSGSIAEDIVNHANKPVWTCRI